MKENHFIMKQKLQAFINRIPPASRPLLVMPIGVATMGIVFALIGLAHTLFGAIGAITTGTTAFVVIMVIVTWLTKPFEHTS